MQGALNVVVGNASDIGDTLLQSTKVLSSVDFFPSNIVLVLMQTQEQGTVVYDMFSFLLGKKNHIHRLNSCWEEIVSRFSKYC